jgi:hypothetical protein
MPTTSAQRAGIVILVFVILLIIAAGGVYYWQSQRPSTAPVFAPEVAGPPPDAMSQLPPDAPVVSYMDVATLRKLQNFPLSSLTTLASGGPQADRQYAAFVDATGFDYTRDLDHAALAYWPAGSWTPANVMGRDRFLAVGDGRFDQQKIKAYVLRTGRTVVRGTQSIYEAPGNPPISIEFLTSTQIMVAGGGGATDLIATTVSRGPQPRDPAMEIRLQRVAGAPLFAVARTGALPPGFYDVFQNAPQLAELARGVKALTLVGEPVGDTLNATLAAECDSTKNAMTISFLLEGGRMAASVALSSPDARKQMSRQQIAFTDALINQAKIKQEGRNVRMSLNVTPAMVGATGVRGK